MLPKYNYIKATFKKIEEFIELEEEKINSNSVIDVQGDIVFSNVGYSYNNYDYLINDCNLTIKKGSHVLLNGPSGIGKSTICKLIYKEMEPTKGNIMIGNNNTKDLDMTSIRNSVLYIGQNEEIFTGSIRDNIVLNRKISENEFQTICDLCEIEEIVSKKEMRFNSLIDPSSKTISGGEKQRIVLARGLLKRANIIILDEALSEVDEMLETKIIGQLRKHFQSASIVTVLPDGTLIVGVPESPRIQMRFVGEVQSWLTLSVAPFVTTT
jgi:ATP-binding cassette subfamily B protein